MSLRYVQLKARAEAFCDRLNDGLMAVAVVLAMTVMMVGTYRTVELLETLPPDAMGQWSADQPGEQAP